MSVPEVPDICTRHQMSGPSAEGTCCVPGLGEGP